MSTLNLEAPVEEFIPVATEPEEVRKYTTVLGTLQDGKVVLPEGVDYPNDTPVLITILQEAQNVTPPADYENYTDEELENMTLGEQIIAGLKDIIAGRYVTITSKEEMDEYLDEIFEEE